MNHTTLRVDGEKFTPVCTCQWQGVQTWWTTVAAHQIRDHLASVSQELPAPPPPQRWDKRRYVL
jgi:hypothetical protein